MVRSGNSGNYGVAMITQATPEPRLRRNHGGGHAADLPKALSARRQHRTHVAAKRLKQQQANQRRRRWSNVLILVGIPLTLVVVIGYPLMDWPAKWMPMDTAVLGLAASCVWLAGCAIRPSSPSPAPETSKRQQQP